MIRKTSQTDLVAAYMDGFRTSDHAQILETLIDDIEWVIHGHRATHGKQSSTARSRIPPSAAALNSTCTAPTKTGPW